MQVKPSYKPGEGQGRQSHSLDMSGSQQTSFLHLANRFYILAIPS